MLKVLVVLCAALVLTLPRTLTAQSAPATTAATINGKTLSIRYSAPSVRAGANAATSFSTDADLVVNKQTGQSGLTYDARQDLGHVKMTMSKPSAVVETLKYTLTDRGAGKGDLRLEWEQHVAAVPFSVK